MAAEDAVVADPVIRDKLVEHAATTLRLAIGGEAFKALTAALGVGLDFGDETPETYSAEAFDSAYQVWTRWDG